MQILHPDPKQALAGLRAMRMLGRYRSSRAYSELCDNRIAISQGKPD
jgi:hypothetical protein